MREKGQSITEIAIISGLICLTTYVGFTFFLGEFGKMMSDATSKFIVFDPFDSQGRYTHKVVKTEIISGKQVEFLSNGSMRFTSGAQTIIIPANAINMNNAVFKTTGSNGDAELIKEINQIVEKYDDLYPPGKAPLQIQFGKSKREQLGVNDRYEGEAAANLVTIQVGNNIVILENDQKYISNRTSDDDDDDDDDNVSDRRNSLYRYRIEGTLNEQNQLINSIVTKYDSTSQEYSKLSGMFLPNKPPALIMSNGLVAGIDGYYIENGDWNWNFNFEPENPEKYFYLHKN